MALPGRELIVTQWDVNQKHHYPLASSFYELIVTQWDVNKEHWSTSPRFTLELIVTQWDVNMELDLLELYKSDRINSYIVGCK